MGSAIGETLIAQGRQVIVWNRTTARTSALGGLGAEVAASPLDVMSRSSGVILALTDEPAMRNLLSLLPASTDRRVSALSVSTLTPDEFSALQADFSARSIDLSEAAVAVYPEHVRRRLSQTLLAALPEHRAFWEELLSDLGSVYHLGAPGDASKAYMAISAAYAFQPITIAFTMAMFNRLGLDAEVAGKLLQNNPSIGLAGAGLLTPDMVNRSYGSDKFTVDNFIIMISQVIETAKSLGMDDDLLVEISRKFGAAADKGFGAKDVSSIYELMA